MHKILFSSVLIPAAFLSSLGAAQSDKNCPLLGPVFQSPQKPNSSKAVESARELFPKVLEDAFASGLLDNQTTSFSINVFSSVDNSTLFTHHFAAPGLNGSLPSGVLNDDTIYRVGSITKLLTAYAILVKNGKTDFEQPITKYVPELAEGSQKDGADSVRWNEVTVGALASHLAGINRDYGLGDLANEDFDPTKLGLPALNETEIPECGVGNDAPKPADIKPCNRDQVIKGLRSQRPVTNTYNTPIYSNAGYALLGYALEKIANMSYKDAMASALWEPLQLKRTSVDGPAKDEKNIIAPGGVLSGFGLNIEAETSAGGVYSTLSELKTLGLSIMQSRLLSQPLTREWMKPVTTTSDPTQAVGAPWEIARQEIRVAPDSNHTRLVDLYAKNGDIGLYSTLIMLDRDHNIGIGILTSGKKSGSTRTALGSLMAGFWPEALEAAAREESKAAFAGTYTSQNRNENTTIVVSADDNRLGLSIDKFITNGVDARPVLGQMFNAKSLSSMRLFPTGLKSGNRLAYRGLFEPLPYTKAQSEGVLHMSCVTWALVSGLQYGGVGLDDFEFVVDEATGKATELRALGFRAALKREG